LSEHEGYRAFMSYSHTTKFTKGFIESAALAERPNFAFV